MDYKKFKEKMMVAVEFAMTLEELEESIQELYTTWKLIGENDFVRFCEEQITGTREDSLLWLSHRGMAILKLENKQRYHNPFPIAGRK